MYVERSTVSRKTPGDGKLEITKHAAREIEPFGESFMLDYESESAAAKLSTMDCTCRGPDQVHVHYFLESERFKRLAPGSDVAVEVDTEGRLVRVRPA